MNKQGWLTRAADRQGADGQAFDTLAPELPAAPVRRPAPAFTGAGRA
jgi:hypothetical protein